MRFSDATASSIASHASRTLLAGSTSVCGAVPQWHDKSMLSAAKSSRILPASTAVSLAGCMLMGEGSYMISSTLGTVAQTDASSHGLQYLKHREDFAAL